MQHYRPAVLVCVSLMAGIIIGAHWSGFSSLKFFSSAFLLSLAGVLLLKSSSSRIFILILLLVLFGMVKIRFDETFRASESVGNFVQSGYPIRLRGTVSEPPRLSEYTLKFIVEAESLDLSGRTAGVDGGVIITLKRSEFAGFPAESLRYGTGVSIYGILGSPGSARNPGEFDLAAYYKLNDIDARIALSGAKDVAITGRHSQSFLALYVVPVRESIGRSIDTYFRGEEASFLKGLLVGERSDIPQEVKMSFINAGVMHILAVSGLHVAIVVMMLLSLFKVLRVPPNIGILLTMLMLVYYNFLTGGAASVTRSVIMGIVFLGGRLFELRSDIYNTLAVSAIVILLIDSRQLFQPGFQLSFAAVFALVYLYPKLLLISLHIPERIRRQRGVKLLISSVAVSVAAGVGTLPFCALYFEKISAISFVANLIIVPLSNVILGLGMFTIAISYFSQWLASIFAQTVSASTGLMLELVQLFGRLPFAYVETHLEISDALLYYYGVFFLVYAGNRAIRSWSIIGLILYANILVYAGLLYPANQRMRAVFLDVGQGDAVVISLANGTTMLVDAGPRSITTDAGSRFVVPFLKRSGVTSIAALVLTHPHSDHLGGIAAVLRRIPVTRVFDAGSAGSGALFSEYEHLIDSLHISHDTLRSGMQIPLGAGCRIQCLSPGIDDLREREVNFNNESIILKIVYRSSTLLLAGDAEEEEEREVVMRYGEYLRSDLLKVGHHGSSTSSSDIFVRNVAPGDAVISVGTKNKFHHPSPAVVTRYLARGCAVHRTDQSGAIVLESDGKRWEEILWH